MCIPDVTLRLVREVQARIQGSKLLLPFFVVVVLSWACVIKA